MGQPIANVGDFLLGQQWDYLTTAPGNTLPQYEFFAVPQGPAKLKAATSLRNVRKLTSPQVMNVWSLGFYFHQDMHPTDIIAFLRNYYYEFRVAGAIQSEGPLWTCPPGAGLTGVSVVAPQSAWNLGVPNPLAVFDLRLPPGISSADGLTGVIIGEDIDFSVFLFGTVFALTAAPWPGLQITCILRGPVRYAVVGGM